MLIDVHAHVMTPELMNRHPFWGPTFTAKGLKVGHFLLEASMGQAVSDEAAAKQNLDAMSVEHRLKIMDERSVDKLVISTSSHTYYYWAGEFGDEYAWLTNEELAKYVKRAPDRFDFWAHANLANPSQAVAQLDHALRNLGAKGLCVGGANFGGLEAHSEELFPVWEKLAEFDAPIMVHGYNQSNNWGEACSEEKFGTTSILGDCFDETLFFWYLINGGALDAFPSLQTYISHAGGMALFQLGRLDSLNRAMSPDRRNKRPIMDYMGNFYFDLDVHSIALRRAVLEEVGADRLLYGTNFGGAYAHPDQTEGLNLSAADREKIRSGNAIKLLKLNTSVGALA